MDVNRAELERILTRLRQRLDGQFCPLASVLHGLDHLQEVAMLAGAIAAEMGHDPAPAMLAGLLHDAARVDDGPGNAHALASAELARKILPEQFPEMPAEPIAAAIAAHADGLVTDDPLAGALWDADRLTIGRAGFRLNVELFSTEPGRRMARQRLQRADGT